MASKYHRTIAWAEFDTAFRELKSLRQINQPYWINADSAIRRAEKRGDHPSEINKGWSRFVVFPGESTADTFDTVRSMKTARRDASESDLKAMEDFQHRIAHIRDLLQRAVDEDAASLKRFAILAARALSSRSF